MADQLNMSGLSLADSQHANGMGGGRSAYIPPHMRGGPSGPHPQGMDGPPPVMNGRINDSTWGAPGFVFDLVASATR